MCIFSPVGPQIEFISFVALHLKGKKKWSRGNVVLQFATFALDKYFLISNLLFSKFSFSVETLYGFEAASYALIVILQTNRSII